MCSISSVARLDRYATTATIVKTVIAARVVVKAFLFRFGAYAEWPTTVVGLLNSPVMWGNYGFVNQWRVRGRKLTRLADFFTALDDGAN